MLYYFMHNGRIYNSARIILVAVIFLLLFFYLLRPINDADFFWHLKTGEWIWQNKSLPSEDPFSFTTPPVHDKRERFILTSYWLSQLLYYLIYLAGGLPWIVFLRFIIVGMLTYIMIKRRRGDSIFYLGLLIIFLTRFLHSYAIDRPQVLSFLFFAILLLLLEKSKEVGGVDVLNNGRLRFSLGLILIPLLMLIWANLHGGYVLGQAVIILYMAMEAVKFTNQSLRPMKRKAYKRLLTTGLLGIIFSLINPNTYQALTIITAIPSYANVEYLSSPEILRRFNDYAILLYWFILLLTITGLLIDLKKADLTEIAILGGTGYFSFTQVRYIAFFLIAALPVIGRSFSKKDKLQWSRVFIIAAALYAAVFFGWEERLNIKNIASGGWINKYAFPVTAAEFIVANDFKGNMYNDYNLGGYLIWRLAPERKVFVDGRSLYAHIYAQSMLIDRAFNEEIAGAPFWKSILNAYAIKYIIIPFFSPAGEMLPLVNALIKDRDWIPVFFSMNSMIFVKDSPENYSVIRKYSIPKDYFIDDLVGVCNKMIMAAPNNIFPYLAKGDIYLSRYKFKEAREAYEKVIEIAPLNDVARARIKLLNM